MAAKRKAKKVAKKATKKVAKKQRRTAAQLLEAEAFIRSAPMKSTTARKKARKVSGKVSVLTPKVPNVNISWRIDPDLLARVRQHLGQLTVETGQRFAIAQLFHDALEEYLDRH